MPPGLWLPVYVKDEKMGVILRGASTTCLCCFMCKLPMIMAVVSILDGGVGLVRVHNPQYFQVQKFYYSAVPSMFSVTICSHFSLCMEWSGSLRIVQEDGLPSTSPRGVSLSDDVYLTFH